MKPIGILVTLDGRYAPPLKTMLKSLFLNNPDERFDIYMAYSDMEDETVQSLEAFCGRHGERGANRLIPLRIGDEMFADAPVLRYWPKSMYYRLLASEILPEHLGTVLYLDPDTLILNAVRPLCETDFAGYLFAAAAHEDLIGISKHINRVRLGTFDSERYYNSGVMLLDLAAQRREIVRGEIFDYVREHGEDLLLPDQDVLNALYGSRIFPLDESLYNYDARFFEAYLLKSQGEKDIDWVVRNTVVLHFCGKNKPWKKSYRNRFGVLYKHYMQLAQSWT